MFMNYNENKKNYTIQYKIKLFLLYITILTPILLYNLILEGFEPTVILFLGIFGVTFIVLLHLLGFFVALDKIIINKKLKKDYKLHIVWLVVTLLPFILFLYFIYLFWSCGAAGCLSGIFFLISLIPAVIIGFISLLFS